MSRGRRRRFRLGLHRPGMPLPPLNELKPLFEPVAPWSDPAIAPVLPLEGMSEWEAIRLPALALHDEPAEPEHRIETSRDPFQLVLEQVVTGPNPVRFALEQADAYDDLEDEYEEDEADEVEPAAPAAVAEAGLTPEQLEAEAELEAVAELEILTEAARADTRLADVAADLIARALEDSSAAAEPVAQAAEAVAVEPEPEPDPIELLFNEAQTTALQGRSEEARELYRRLLAQRPLHVRARNNLALLLDAAGDHNGALAELDRALDVEQENNTLLVNRGALLGQMGRFQAAERDLKRVLRDDPNHAEALFNLGVVMTKKGLWAEAVPALKRAIELDGDRAAAHFYLGEALNHVDDLPGAMQSYQRAAELMPNHSRALYGLGIVYDRMGRPDDAARMYRRSREVAQPTRR